MKTSSNYLRSVRYAGFVTMIATASLVQACSSDAIPTDPSHVATATASGSEAFEIRVSGTVRDDDGVPVAGARVTLYRWTPTGDPRSTLTDGKGFYSMPFVGAIGISAVAEKEGFERTWRSQNISRSGDLQFDLKIHRLKR